MCRVKLQGLYETITGELDYLLDYAEYDNIQEAEDRAKRVVESEGVFHVQIVDAIDTDKVIKTVYKKSPTYKLKGQYETTTGKLTYLLDYAEYDNLQNAEDRARRVVESKGVFHILIVDAIDTENVIKTIYKKRCI